MDLAICGAADWNVSTIFCNPEPLPVLPACFQHVLVSWPPFLFVVLGCMQIVWGVRKYKLKLKNLQPLTYIRLTVIVGLIISQLCVLVWAAEIHRIETISAGVVLALLVLLAMVVICQDCLTGSYCSAPCCDIEIELSRCSDSSSFHTIPVSLSSLFYFWLLFLLSRTPLVILFNNDGLDDVVPVSHLVSFILAFFGFFLECFPLKPSQSLSSPEDLCSHASMLLFGWLDPLFWKGLKSPLSRDKIPSLQESFSVTKILEVFDKVKPLNPVTRFEGERNVTFSNIENKEKGYIVVNPLDREEKQTNVTKSLAKSFGGSFLIAALMKLVQDLLKFVIPQILKNLITFVKDSNLGSGCGSSPWVGYFYAISIFSIGIFQSVLLQAYWKRTYSVALRVRTALFSELYKKTLNINPTSRKDYTVGEIVTLMSTDAQTFQQVIPSLNKVWSMPLQIVLAIYFLYQEIGLSVFGGVIILVLLIPFNTAMGKKSQSVNREQLKSKDKRVRRIYELLNSLKIIKLYAWENIFEKRVTESRDSEIIFLRKNAIIKAVINFVFGSAPILVTLVTFAVYVSIDTNNILTPEKAFVCLTLFSMLRLPMKLLPNILTDIFRLNVSIKRINAFLNCADINQYVGYLDDSPSSNVDIQIQDGSFSWNNGPIFLHDINLAVKKGTFHAIAGPTASGKSSLLAAILGQMSHQKGKIATSNKSMAYVSQEAWMQNKTIKENIVFGKPVDAALYQRVIQSCALNEDLLLLAEGDQTMVGENGVNLSGGQKQRISLARAVYSNADIYLLDDCLSAVDVHVGSHLTHYVLGKQGILAGKTRVMVTHNLGVLKVADSISYMEDGTLVNSREHNGEHEEEQEDCEEKVISGEHCNSVLNEEVEDKISEKKLSIPIPAQQEKSKNVQDRLKDKSIGSGSAFISSYKMYLKNFGVFNILLVISLYILNQSLTTGASVWLTHWSDKSGKGSITQNNKTEEFNNDVYIAVYGAIGLGTAICAFVRNLHLFVTAAGASRLIHSKLFQSVIKGELSFFESTSSGSIISRFSSDIDAVDLKIPNHMSALLFNSFELLAVIVTISYSSPEFLIAVAPILVMFYGIKVFYIQSSRQIKRLESSSNAPIYTHFSETVRGISSIKAFGQVPRFVHNFEELVATNLKFSYYSVMCSRWLNLRSELVAQFLVLSASLVAVINRDTFSSGWAGLIISLALSVTETFNCLLVALTNLEDQATVVERIKELTNHTPQEKTWVSEHPPEKSWPGQGVIEFQNYSTGYSNGIDILRNISFQTKSGEKLAIVGRTGAGKSSMGLACLRILEAREGKILIDEVDIGKLGLHELRSAVTIIPQDPVLFTGSLRDNIDPEGTRADFEISQLLTTSNLEKHKDLNMEVEEGGANFSQGEKQLVCLVRALCRGSRVVIMDEATASVDEETDSMIQKIIRDEFHSCTVMTIAHRLNTIMDYDRVMVMESGEIKEMGKPSDLALNDQSLFYQMIN